MNKINDNYKEHELHRKFDRQCSTCFSERLQRAEGCGLSYTGDLDIKGYPEFIGTQDQWEAFDSVLKLCSNCSIPCENLYCEKCQREIENGENYYH